MAFKYSPTNAALLILIGMALPSVMTQYVPFDTNFVELDSSKMISTGDSNYAICNANFSNNWKSVSVNGDEVIITTKDRQQSTKRLSALTTAEKSGLESSKSQLMNVIRMGPFNVKSQSGLSKLTTFDRNGGSSSMGSGGSASSSSSSSSSSSGGASISRTGPNSFIVSKQDFPFNWHRVFVNEDLTTIVYKTGRVLMLPQDLMRPNEKQKLIELRKEVDQSSQAAQKLTQSMTNSFTNPMDFVNKALGGMFG